MVQDAVRQLPDGYISTKRGIIYRLNIDFLLLALLLLLGVYGLLVLYSASDQDMGKVYRQATYWLMGLGVIFCLAQIRLVIIKKAIYWLYGIAFIFLILVAVMGSGAKGAQRWLEIAGFRFQPSEFMKLCVPITLATYLSSRSSPPKLISIIIALLIIMAPAILVIKQPDLGTAILIAVPGLLLLFFAGLRWSYIVIAFLLFLLSLWPVWHYVLQEYQKQRVMTMFNPEADILGTGWNIIQSKIAIGSGGFAGKGWLHGTQSALQFLPEGHTDFIIAVLAEEFGFRGILILLFLYALLIIRGLTIAITAHNKFNSLLAASLTVTFMVYVFVNMGMVSGLLPIVGVPLPLISYGGTAMITLLIGFGLLMAINADK